MGLQGRRVAALVANEGVEQAELTDPSDAIRNAGGSVLLVAPKPGEVQAFQHLDKGDTFPVDRPVAEVSVDDFDALLLPGGVANPDQLRTEPAAVDLVRSFVASGKPVAVICHGPWTLVEADVLAGRTITSWPSLRTDISNAGGRGWTRRWSSTPTGPVRWSAAASPPTSQPSAARWSPPSRADTRPG